MTQDPAENPKSDQALKNSERQLACLIQAVTDYAIYMLDPHGRIMTWNAGAERIKGFAPGEIVGQNFSRFYTAGDRIAGEPQRGLAAAVRDDRFECEGFRIRKDGSQFWANVVIVPIRDPSGDLIGFAKVTRDITERKAAQLALEQTRAALFQSQKMEAIGQLTGGIAHDFNNLLTAILGSLEIVLARTPFNPATTPLITNALRGAQRGVTLTRRMLTFAGRRELRAEVVDVALLVQGMSDLLKQSLGSVVTLETRFPLGLAQITADSHQLELAVLNLALNARDAMPEGGAIVIEARARTDRDGALPQSAFIILSITDSGEGMDEAILARAIEPFFTTKDAGKGTGLGLSMVHSLMADLGGMFRLRSRRGEGTTAELWLPVAETAGDLALTEPASDAIAAEAREVALCVLAVDDDELVLTNIVIMLQMMGHLVYGATSAAGALDILRRQPAVELIVTDHKMPSMTGLQLAQAIWAERPQFPILVVSAHAGAGKDMPLGLSRLAKPFTQDDLKHAVAAAVASPWRVAEASERH